MMSEGPHTLPRMPFIERAYARLIAIQTLVILFLALLAGTAFAGTDPDDAGGILQTSFDAVSKGEWWLLAGCVLSLVHLALRTWGPVKGWLGGGDATSKKRDVRGFVSIVLMGLIGGMGHAWLAQGMDAAFSMALLVSVVKVVATAVLAYVGVKKTTSPSSSPDDPPFA